MQFCNASGCTFNCSASRRITGLGSTPDTDSRYNRTARTQLDGILPVRGDKNGLQDQTWFGSLRKTGNHTPPRGQPGRRLASRSLATTPTTAWRSVRAGEAHLSRTTPDPGWGANPFFELAKFAL